MDAIDAEILSLLQDDGRMSATELAQRVGLSLSSCHRRLKELEGSGVIEGYRAQVDPSKVGLGFEALIFVTMGQTDLEVVERFEAAVEGTREVVSAQRLFGSPDYMLKIFAEDLQAYQRLYDTQLTALPGVQRLSSTLVMKDIVKNRELPVSVRPR